MTTTAQHVTSPSESFRAVAQPITPADRCAVSGAALAGAADQLVELAAQLEADPDLQLPAELQRSGIGPLQLHGAARWLTARAGLYGATITGAAVVGFWDEL